ncbi:hypothetical protein [Mesorhizobium loti]|nr:hypothetical protein [Mesorhizobium loti]
MTASQKRGTIYIGVTSDITDAIQREKSLKRWRCQWKIGLIEKANPEWFELFRGTGW